MAKTILVADDSKTIRHVVQLAFQATDYRVVGVDSGRDAIERARADRPDLVLADVGMPGVDGYQVCQAIKDGPTAHIPVVLMAGAFEAFDERRAQAARADGHIKKPFETQKLLDQVNLLTAQARAAAQAAAPAPVASPPAAPVASVAPAPVAADLAPPPSAFRAPLAEPRDPPVFADAAPASSSWEEQPIEEVEPIDDAEPIDELEVASPGYGPSLEPPPAPDPELEAHRRSVDVWALSDESEPAAAAPSAPRSAFGRGEDAPAAAEVPGYGFEDEPVAGPPTTPAAAHTTPAAAPAALSPAIAKVGAALAPAIADQAAAALPSGLPREDLLRMAREVVEQIAWEVVPELAETIIREELRRLLAERS